jgi:hypothetical protein
VEECKGNIGSIVPFLMNINKNYVGTALSALGWIGDEGNIPTNHPPSPSN